jgi:hypothetical protein
MAYSEIDPTAEYDHPLIHIHKAYWNIPHVHEYKVIYIRLSIRDTEKFEIV